MCISYLNHHIRGRAEKKCLSRIKEWSSSHCLSFAARLESRAAEPMNKSPSYALHLKLPPDSYEMQQLTDTKCY
jgi:hypothetical protein